MKHILLLFLLFFTYSARAEMKVVASYPPIQSLVWQITEGVEPVNLIHKKGQASHHDIQLKPSQIKTLKNADIVFWAGPELENYMKDALNSAAPNALSVPLMTQVPDLKLIPSVSNPQKQDPHFWLDIDNAVKALKEIEKVMSEKNPKNQARYQSNYEKAKAYLESLKSEMSISPSDKRFVALHDGFDYFFEYFDLNGTTLGVEPENMSTPQAVQEFRQKLKQFNPACVIVEPSITRRQIDALGLRDYGLQKTDAFGWNINTGPGQLYKLIKWNFMQLQKCKR